MAISVFRECHCHFKNSIKSNAIITSAYTIRLTEQKMFVSSMNKGRYLKRVLHTIVCTCLTTAISPFSL